MTYELRPVTTIKQARCWRLEKEREIWQWVWVRFWNGYLPVTRPSSTLLTNKVKRVFFLSWPAPELYPFWLWTHPMTLTGFSNLTLLITHYLSASFQIQRLIQRFMRRLLPSTNPFPRFELWAALNPSSHVWKARRWWLRRTRLNQNSPLEIDLVLKVELGFLHQLYHLAQRGTVVELDWMELHTLAARKGEGSWWWLWRRLQKGKNCPC